MNLSRYQKLVLSIASVLAFVIWLFPHWRLQAVYPRSIAWARRDGGYAFLFTPPPARFLDGGSTFWRPEVDWPRQCYEWGTLAFLTGFALAGMAVWQGKPTTRSGPRPPTLREPHSQNQPNQAEPQ
jgi:hypothetical protein